jgi:hypothetical protein
MKDGVKTKMGITCAAYMCSCCCLYLSVDYYRAYGELLLFSLAAALLLLFSKDIDI